MKISTAIPSSSSSTVSSLFMSPSPPASTRLSKTAKRLLEDSTYDIEFHGFLSNHAKHAVIALDRLGAPESRTQEYWDQYTTETPYGFQLHPVKTQNWDLVKPATPDEWNREWRGKKTRWQEQVRFLKDELESESLGGDTDKLIQEYAPDLLPGIAGALTHGLIHLGWAIDADNNPWMICEGLAYLNFCYLPLDTSLLKHIKEEEEEEESNNKNDTHGPSTERTPIDSLIRVAKTWDSEQLKETWIERVKSKYDETFHPELVPAGFQWHLSKILNEPHPIATELPSWIKEIPLSDELWKSMYQAMVYLYLSMRTPALVQNDDSKEQEYNGGFVLLHLMTSLWGLEHIVKSLKRRDGSDISDEIDRTAIGIYYANMIILTATSVAGFPSVSALQRTREEFPLTITETDTDTDTDTDDNFNWDKIVERALKEEEEHNIKLVYIMKELWKRYDHWSGFYEAARSFTVTPNIGPKSTKTDA